MLLGLGFGDWLQALHPVLQLVSYMHCSDYWTGRLECFWLQNWNKTSITLVAFHSAILWTLTALLSTGTVFALLDQQHGHVCWARQPNRQCWSESVELYAMLCGMCRQGDPQHPADPSWRPLLATPNHPEFPSTHSVSSGAAAAILAR